MVALARCHYPVPGQAEATVTVTAAGGESLRFEATPASLAPEGCRSAEGSLFWDGPAGKGFEAAALGEAPFTYLVELVRDGLTSQGTATWPDEVIPDREPGVWLTFDPPLPAVAARGA
jgi:hypothetical protein